MSDRILHQIAKLFLEDLGADSVRILDGGVDVKTNGGTTLRVEVTRL